MTLTAHPRARSATEEPAARFRLHRAGILNVWQYDDQEFLLGEGRMLLRGANGAGKSKTLEMLLPFCLDGDRARITASARHSTSLLWLMTDGYDGQARVGYVWVEFVRPTPQGEEAFTCGVGIRASASAKTASAWFFTTSRRVGHDLRLEDAGGPLPRPRLEEALGDAGQVFTQASAYKEHVGRQLFGLDAEQYDDVLRLLYWLRQPQVGEEIQPDRLAGQLAEALPQLEDQAVRAAGDTFDELAAFGEQLRRRTAAAESLTNLAAGYARYSRGVLAARAAAVLDAIREEGRRRTLLHRQERELATLTGQRDDAEARLAQARRGTTEDESRIRELESGPEARDQRRLAERADLADQQQRLAAGAEARAEDAEREHASRLQRVRELGREVGGRLRQHAGRLRDLDAAGRAAGVDRTVPVPAALDERALSHGRFADAAGADTDVDAGGAGTAAATGDDGGEAADPSGLVAAVAQTQETVHAFEGALGQRRAAVEVVATALDELDQARRDQEAEQRLAAEAEQRSERSRANRETAEAAADAATERLVGELTRWEAEDDAVPVSLPDALDPEPLTALAASVRAEAAPRLGELRAGAAQAGTRRDRAAETIADLTTRRARIDSESDPAPAPPVLGRTPRLDGAPLWRLVDFAGDLDDTARAGLEAALEGSGLLDSWVRPDGAVLPADAHDQVLLPASASGGSAPGPTLAEALRPDPAAGSGVAAEVVLGVLRRVRLVHGGQVPEPDDGPSVGVDGTWSLAPMHGRAAKERAQYVGATARAGERRRRLAEVDRLLGQAGAEHQDAQSEFERLTRRVGRIEAWLDRLPPVQPVLTAATRLDERRVTEAADAGAFTRADHVAREAREHATRVHDRVRRLAAEHDVPAERAPLRALEERLRALASNIGSVLTAVPALGRDLDRLGQERADLAAQHQRVQQLVSEAAELRSRSDATAVALAELRASVGATVRLLEERLAALRTSSAAHQKTARECEQLLRTLDERTGSARAAVEHAAADLADQQSARAATLSELAQVSRVPGLLEAARQPGGAPADTDRRHFRDGDPTLLAGAESAGADPLPAELLEGAQRWAALGGEGADADVNVVWRAYNEAVSGPAADHEPTVAEFGSLLAVTGRDDAGDAPVATLAQRVAAGVERDRALLTERERSRFEQHVLGELGDAIRRCRLEAEELVEAMNRLLAGVTTSQGIRVRLDWRLREEVPADAVEAVRLLVQPVGALLPEERARLRDALHRLIEASRVERPELSYAEHLSAALDYRRWFAFRIRYTRPESQGSWLELHRRSPLSQGEQKVLCYLPLFAAAAAHFTSLAGAAPHAPRLVLLDDAFPKIDVRTHPLLFGLLVQLDLDFVVTSERLWGAHDTVPSLAIYEALRDPAQRGIAQYEHRWDGRQLRSIG